MLDLDLQKKPYDWIYLIQISMFVPNCALVLIYISFTERKVLKS